MTELHDELRNWATGMYPTVAATELLIRSGRAYAGAPWIKESNEQHWIDFDSIYDQIGGLSGGEQRIMEIVASLGGQHQIVLQDTISGLDRTNAELALAAISHAAGHHEGGRTIRDGKWVTVDPSAIYEWPTLNAPEPTTQARTQVEGLEPATQPSTSGSLGIA